MRKNVLIFGSHCCCCCGPWQFCVFVMLTVMLIYRRAILLAFPGRQAEGRQQALLSPANLLAYSVPISQILRL